MKSARYYICWPTFDAVCLQGGCLYCQDNEVIKTKEEILNQLAPEFDKSKAEQWLDENTNRRVK